MILYVKTVHKLRGYTKFEDERFKTWQSTKLDRLVDQLVNKYLINFIMLTITQQKCGFLQIMM